MRLLLTAIPCPKGDVETNLHRHDAAVALGRVAGCDLVLLPEMSLTGYRPSAAVPLTHPAVRRIVDDTATGPMVCFGLVECNGGGGAPYITQLVAGGGRVIAIHRKAHLGEGEDGDFVAGAPAGVFDVEGIPCSLAVCAEIGTRPPYHPDAQLILGPAAPGLYGERRSSDEDWQRGFDWWRGSVIGDAKRLLRPGQWLAVSTQAGATDDEDFPGWAALIGPGGAVAAELADWREGTLVVEVAGRIGSPPSVSGG